MGFRGLNNAFQKTEGCHRRNNQHRGIGLRVRGSGEEIRDPDPARDPSRSR